MLTILWLLLLAILLGIVLSSVDEVLGYVRQLVGLVLVWSCLSYDRQAIDHVVGLLSDRC